jgi:hypothetical protein
VLDARWIAVKGQYVSVVAYAVGDDVRASNHSFEAESDSTAARLLMDLQLDAEADLEDT